VGIGRKLDLLPNPPNVGGFNGFAKSNGNSFPNNCIKHLFNHNVTCTFLLVFEMKEGGLCGI